MKLLLGRDSFETTGSPVIRNFHEHACANGFIQVFLPLPHHARRTARQTFANRGEQLFPSEGSGQILVFRQQHNGVWLAPGVISTVSAIRW